ncbi:restriction endonuclease subunit S [Serratia inhibens]
MSVDKNVPEIRFEGFSGEWESFPLEGISDVLDGDRGHNYPNGEELKEQGHTLFLSASNVTKNGFRFDTRQYITQEKSESLGSGKLIIDDIVLTSRGSIGHVAWYNENITREIPFARINSGMLILRVNNNIDPSVISQYLKSPKGKKKIEIISFGSAQPQLTKASILKFPVTIPSEKPEQTQIGNYFLKLDNLINQHQQKHDKLSNIKKAMLEKMFPKQGETIPEIRFKGFSREWKTSELSELALFNPKNELPESFKYVDLESVKGTSLIGYKIESRDSAPSRAQRLAKKGDVFYQTVRPYQKNNYLFNGVENDYVFSTGYAQLRPYFNGNFLLNLVQRDSFVKNVLDNCTGTSYPAINASALATLEVSYPKSEVEQTQIGTYFQKLDALINQHQQQITKLNNIKQACLSKMFV